MYYPAGLCYMCYIFKAHVHVIVYYSEYNMCRTVLLRIHFIFNKMFEMFNDFAISGVTVYKSIQDNIVMVK